MAEGKICVCPQCGKKFKLKADFAAASFACTGCGATVWVAGKPEKPSSPRRRSTGGGRSAAGKAGAGKAAAGRGRRGGGARAPVARGQRRGRGAPPADEEHEAGRRHFQKQDNTQNVIFAVVGLVVVIGVIAFYFMQKDDLPAGTTGNTTASGGSEGTGTGTEPGGVDEPADENPETGGTESADPNAGESGTQAGDASGGDSATAKTEPGAADGETKKPSPLKADKPGYRIDEKTGKRVRISRWNPPDDIGHLESTPADQRKQIDDLIAVMFDPFAGSDCFDAKQKLAQMGKPAYLPILASMVKAQKNFKWDNSHDDNVNMSSVKLADECLRMMDGYLEANNIGVIRPGTDEKYYGYVVRMHYKRWVQTLADLDKMPGPYDPSGEYEKETETVD